MVKKVIEPFIYTGQSDWYLRIPLTQPKGCDRTFYDRQYFHTEYLKKDQYTLRQVLSRRLQLVTQFENEGRRKIGKGSTRICSSTKFIQEEADGKYNKYDKS